MMRIAVIGNGGGGKTTMCRRRLPWLIELIGTFRESKRVIDIRSPRELRAFMRQYSKMR